MAIGFAHCEIVHASAGSSAVGLSAYITRENRQDMTTGESYSFAHKSGDLIDRGIMLPDGAPERFRDGESLWGAAMAAETTVDRKTHEVRFKKNAQVAKHVVLALPKECTDAERRELTERFVRDEFVKHGVAAEWAIHAPDEDNGNWHAHVLVSTRRVEAEGFGKKCQEINPSFARNTKGQRFVSEDDRLTDRWADTQTRFFRERGLEIEVDPYGSKLSQQEHLGPTWHMADSRKADRQTEALAEAERKARQEPGAVLEAVTQRKATFTLRDVERTLRKAGLAGDEFETARTAVLMHPELVPLARREADGSLKEIGRFTTQAVRAQEQQAIERAGRVAERHRPVAGVAVETAAGSRTLDAEQRAALDHACRPDGLAIIEGRAGAGKSYTMGAIREAHERSGYQVIGLAPTNTVAQDLRDKGGAGIKQTSTVHLALLRQENGRERPWTERTVLMVDEAAMLDAKVMDRLLRWADQCGAKVVLVGDDRQLASVERGGLFAEMRERHGSVEIREIRRQAEDWQRQASKDFSDGRITAGLEAYDRRGFVRWNDRTDDAKAALVADWARAQAERPDAVRFVYASTNREVDDLNRQCRAIRVQRGEIAAGEAFQTVRGPLQMAAGDRLQFYGNDRAAGIYNGTVGTVEQAQQDRITVRLDSGQSVSFDPRRFDTFGHGYAGTVYRGQGKTQLEVSALYDNTAGWNARTAYVGMTRHKATVNLYVGRDMAPDRAALARQMGRSEDVSSSLRYEVAPQRVAVEAPKPERKVTTAERLAAAARAAKQTGPDPLAQAQREAALRRVARAAVDRADDPLAQARAAAQQTQGVRPGAAVRDPVQTAAERYTAAWKEAADFRRQYGAALPEQQQALKAAGADLDRLAPRAAEVLNERLAAGRPADLATLPDAAKARNALHQRADGVLASWQQIGARMQQIEGMNSAPKPLREEYAALAGQQWSLACQTAQDGGLMQVMGNRSPVAAKGISELATRSQDQVQAQIQSIARALTQSRGYGMSM